MTRIKTWALAALLAIGGAGAAARAAGRIDAGTLITISQGNYNGVQYTRYEAMFAGVTPNNRAYRVPCQIIAPRRASQGSGLLVFDWLVRTTIFTAVEQEQADARYIMKDEFLFGGGAAYATVRCDPAGIGRRSAIS